DTYSPPAAGAAAFAFAAPAATDTPSPMVPTWIDLPGETSDTLVIENLTPDHDGRAYRVLATNPFGSLATAPSVLSVHYPALIADQPADVEVTAGDAATFRASARANPAPSSVTWQSRAPGGQWAFATDGAADTAAGTGSTTTTLTVTDVDRDLDGYEYRAVFVNEVGTVITEPATLSVRWAAQVIEHP